MMCSVTSQASAITAIKNEITEFERTKDDNIKNKN